MDSITALQPITESNSRFCRYGVMLLWASGSVGGRSVGLSVGLSVGWSVGRSIGRSVNSRSGFFSGAFKILKLYEHASS